MNLLLYIAIILVFGYVYWRSIKAYAQIIRHVKSHHRLISRSFNYFRKYPLWPYPSFMWDILTDQNLVLDDFLAKKIKEHTFYRILSFIFVLLCVLGFMMLSE